MGKSKHRSRSRSPVPKKKRKSRSKSKSKKKRKHVSRSSSTSSESESSSSTSTSSSDSSTERQKSSSEFKKHKRKKKSNRNRSSSSSSLSPSRERKKHKKKKKRKKKKSSEKLTDHQKSINIEPVVAKQTNKDKETKNDPPNRTMKPMTKEEWEKHQSVIRRVYDPETGRNRLVKGDGEILEEIISKDRHKEINKQSTMGDGVYFQTVMGLNKK